MDMYKSQYGQDKWLNDNIFKNKKNGVFLEIGALDGVVLSNTHFFEKELEWTGICFEPNSNQFEQLEKNRTCIKEKIALSDFVGTSEFLEIYGYGKGLSGIVEDYDPQHLKRIGSEIQNQNNLGSKKVTVSVDKLDNILEKHKLYYIDFCSIDTEGSEYKILKDFNFEKFFIKVIMVENNYHNDKVPSLLKSKGYELINEISVDQIFIRK
jgi:FkbM family methyltransferase